LRLRVHSTQVSPAPRSHRVHQELVLFQHKLVSRTRSAPRAGRRLDQPGVDQPLPHFLLLDVLEPDQQIRGRVLEVRSADTRPGSTRRAAGARRGRSSISRPRVASSAPRTSSRPLERRLAPRGRLFGLGQLARELGNPLPRRHDVRLALRVDHPSVAPSFGGATSSHESSIRSLSSPVAIASRLTSSIG